MMYNPIYKRRKPSTVCRYGKCDNPKYPSLCRKIEPVPTNSPYDFDSIATDPSKNILDSAATRPFCTATSYKL